MSKLIRTVAGVAAAMSLVTANARDFSAEESRFDDSKFVSTQSRADVARQARGVLDIGEVSRFVDAVGPTKSRAQVVAETREAARLGLIGYGQVTVFATPAQLEQIRVAGLRAVADTPLAAATR